MDLKYKLNLEDGEYDLFVDAAPADMDYLHRLALTILLENDMFPFRLLSDEDACNFHQPPEMIQ